MFIEIETPSAAAKNLHRGLDTEPIAIIGVGCRFPGANGPDELWQLLREGVDAISNVPSDRFDLDSVYDPRPGTPGKIISRAGGFLGHMNQFDASFFGISPREALRMDPQQRLLLEVTWEALEDAGIPPDQLAGSDTGVFIGACASDYEDIQYHLRDRSEIDLYVATGTARSVLSGRISYTLDLLGPSLTVDTACSSSLVAAHLACQSLWNGESSLAIAGGVNLVLLPELSMPFSRANMLAPDSRCKFGDAGANGFTRSDGAAVVLLKPLSKAKADRDPIYAIILGSAINNDGRSSGLLATPSREGQEAVLRQAYRRAGISPGAVQYVEVHGTGTSVGDPVEVESLGKVLAEDRPADSPCLLGSIKTNIGHTEGAAGVAGLIKVALSLKHKAIPPSLHFNDPNPTIHWEGLPLLVSGKLTPWPQGSGPARAGVSAFGLSATNAHIVLQEPPEASEKHAEDSHCDRAHVLTLSARSPKALEEMASAYLDFSKATNASPGDICYSASLRRTHHEYRLAVAGRSREELGVHLKSFLDKKIHPGLAHGHKSAARGRKLVFVFPGQGSQWLGMGCQLMRQEPVFKNALVSCDEAFKRFVNWSLIEELNANGESSRLGDIDVVQPCLFAIQVALARLWQHWGIEPGAVVAQSMGEVAAAHVAGALTLEDAARIICRRSILLKRVRGRGGMAVLGLSFDETQRVLSGYEERLSIAVSSSPTSTVISGDRESLLEVMETLRQRSVFCQPVKVDVASHSPQMDVLQEDLLEALTGINPQAASASFYSTVTGDEVGDMMLDARYWVSNLREPVLFSKAVERVLENGYDTFIEISPHSLLSGPIQQTLQQFGREAIVLPSLRHEEDERAVMLGSLGALYAAGCTVDWAKLFSEASRFVKLPSYRWQRETFWLGPEQRTNKRQNRATDHLLSGSGFESAADPGKYFWEFDLSSETFPFLKDHRVQDAVVIPAAAYLEMALTAGRQLFFDAELCLENVDFKQALVLGEDDRRVQLVISSHNRERATFEFFSLESGEGYHSWTLHATGAIRVAQAQPAPPDCPIEATMDRFKYAISKSFHYDLLAKRGLQYGPCFQGLQELWRGDNEAIARVIIPDPVVENASNYYIHPSFLDSCFQVLAATLPISQSQTYLPVGLESLRMYQRPGASAHAYATLRDYADKKDGVLKGDLLILDDEGRAFVEARGMRMKRLGQEKQSAQDEQLLYKIEWRPAERPRQAHDSQAQVGTWLVFTDRGGAGGRLIASLLSGGEDCISVSAGDGYARPASGHYQINPSSPDDYARLLSEAFKSGQRTCRGVIHLWSLDAPNTHDLPRNLPAVCHERAWGSALQLVKALAALGQTNAPRLWLVTRATQTVTGDESLSVAQSPLWGLGRVIAQEHPEFRCSLVDLGRASEHEVAMLRQELTADSRDNQVALRAQTRYVARLVRYDAIEPVTPEREDAAEGKPFRLEVTTPGLLDNLIWRRTARQTPGPGELEIQVHAVGLNFRDVMLAMGVLPSAPGVEEDFGWECAGEVVSVGEGVEEFSIGDEVYAIAHPCFGAYTKTRACLALRKPPTLSFEEAAAIPLALLTAHYSLNHVGRLQKGERILIHSATGGVGLAALRIAQQQGAEIFATAGTEEKRLYLKSLGVRHVFDSRSLDFADEIKRITGGTGIDMVLNSLSGEAIPAGLSILRSRGRFIELGRRDIYQNAKLDLAHFQNNLSFFAIDLARLLHDDPAHMGSLLREAIKSLEQTGGSPPPIKVFSMAEVGDGFRSMAQASHIGKIAFRARGETVMVSPAPRPDLELSRDATYLITGGLGGLGLSVARKMIECGARHLVLVSRKEGSQSVKEYVEALRQTADVLVAQADVSDHKEVARVLDHITQCMPPLKGVVHAAGLLDDGILLQQDHSRFLNVMAPKIAGAWNLHSLTLDKSLDFFALFSSAAALIGSAGQGNYSAANSFLDCLAHYRRSQGLPAISIDWGPWSEVGLAAESNRAERLAQKGIKSITPAEGVQVFKRLLNVSAPQVAVMDLNLEQWTRSHAVAVGSAFFSEIIADSNTDAPAIESVEAKLTRAVLLAADEAGREKLLQQYLGSLLARVLGFGERGADRLDTCQPINRFGIDSLMALEMKTRIEADLGIPIPIMSFLKGSSIAHLTAYALDQLLISNPRAECRKAKKAAAAANEQWEELSI